MKINVARSAGFCFGVRRALKIAVEAARSNLQVEMLGDIVHNEEVVKELNRMGIKTVKRLSQGKDKALLIRAHGALLETIRKASQLGYRIIDATCPRVKKIHTIARNAEKKGYRIIIIGDKKHDEVRGIKGQLKQRPLVIENLQDILLKRITRMAKAAVVVQSTQNLEKTMAIVALLRREVKDLRFYNTICKPTRVKQGEIQKMPLENEVMVIIGSRTSANTRRLYEISKSLNKRSYWIQHKGELKRRWFEKVESVGIMAGASTPDTTTREVIEWIRNIRS